jgi:hypothetical protein
MVTTLFAHMPPPGDMDMLVLLLIFLGPFVLAGTLLIAAMVICIRSSRAAGVCVLLAALSFLIGCGIWWNA